MTPSPADAAKVSPEKAPIPPIGRDFVLEGRLVQPDLDRIVVDGSPVSIEPKIMQVLARLAASPRTLVTKEDLFHAAWNGTFVTDDVLTRAIGELRKIFADDPANPRVIETIRKKGYRLLAEPRPPSPAKTSPAPGSPPAAGMPGAGFARGAAVAAGLLALLAAGLLLFRRSPAPKPVRIVPVTTFPGNEVRPALSPDGTRVAFTWERRGQKPGIWVKLIDAATPLRLTESPGADRYPAWSPDGQLLAFSRVVEGKCELSAVPAIGGPVRKLADCSSRDGVKPSWSPDGASIALAARAPDGQWRIEIFDVAGGSRRPVTSPPPGIDGDSEPAFSPDGRSIAFVRTMTDGVDDLYVVPARGGEARRLTFEYRALTGVDWSPDGKSLVFSSSRAGLFSLWRLPLSGGEPLLVGGGGSKMKHPSAARAVDAIAYENWNYEVNLWSVPLAGPSDAKPPLRVTFATDEWEFDPEFSPDGARIAYVSTKTGAPEIWTTDLRGGNPVQVTTFRGPQVGTPRWSPDGRSLVFSARPEGQADLYLVPASGGSSFRLTRDAGDEVSPAFSRDGKFVYFASRRSGSWQIWKLPAGGGVARVVTRGGGSTSFESPDGRWLYFTRPDANGLWRMPADGGAEEIVTPGVLASCAHDWTVTKRGVYFKEDRGDDAAPIVRLLPFGGTQASPVAVLDEPAWAGFTVAPDDSALVYGRADRREADIRMIENPF
jgi:Tol biopolymer transport system component/DNA-binding winged helix-turn-helix (wHTH) protein